jgi:hypothetical protein
MYRLSESFSLDDGWALDVIVLRRILKNGSGLT